MPVHAVAEQPAAPVQWIEHSGTWARQDGDDVPSEEPLGEQTAATPGPAAERSELPGWGDWGHGEGRAPDNLPAPPRDTTPSGLRVLATDVAVSYVFAVPILAAAYFVLWTLAVVLHAITSIMSPWLFDRPTSLLPVDGRLWLWIPVAAAPLAMVAGLVRSQTRGAARS